MRHNPTEAEEQMWNILRNVTYGNFPDYVFHRQYVQYGYILDFYCPRLRLGIEVDGSIHDNQREYDYYRDLNLQRRGIEVLRYTNDQVLSFRAQTTTHIYQVLKYKQDHPPSGFAEPTLRCFIATAAYGTPFAREVITLRLFRDTRMSPSWVGRHLVKIYYILSPPIAKVIARNSEFRAFVRWSLKHLIRLLE